MAVLTRLDHWYGLLRGGAAERGQVHAAYRKACSTIGREVELHVAAGDVRRALAVGVDDDGRLVVRGATGEYAVAAGDVVHVRSAAG